MKKHRTIAIVLLAAILACSSAFPQQPTQPAYAFASAIPDGTVIAGHTFDHSVKYSGFAEINDSGDIAFLVQWPAGPGHPSPYKAIYTKEREVVAEGETFDKMTIVELTSLRPGDIQINNAGNVGYFAKIRGHGCSEATCLTVLINKTVVGAAIAGATFLLTDDDNKIAGGPGMTTPQSASSAPKQSGGGGFLRSIAGTLTGPLRVYFPIRTVHFPGIGNVLIGGGAPMTFPTIPGVPNGAPKREAAVASRPEPIPVRAACQAMGVTPFPFPWPDNATAAGPIGSVSHDGPFEGTRHKPSNGTAPGYWQRRIYYSPTCLPIMSALFDSSGRGTLEISSPAGTIGYFDQAQGSYVFNGVERVAPPTSGVPIESLMRISRRCQVLLPVTFAAKLGAEKGLLVGTPINPGAHCPSE